MKRLTIRQALIGAANVALECGVNGDDSKDTGHIADEYLKQLGPAYAAGPRLLRAVKLALSCVSPRLCSQCVRRLNSAMDSATPKAKKAVESRWGSDSCLCGHHRLIHLDNARGRCLALGCNCRKFKPAKKGKAKRARR